MTDEDRMKEAQKTNSFCASSDMVFLIKDYIPALTLTCMLAEKQFSMSLFMCPLDNRIDLLRDVLTSVTVACRSLTFTLKVF